jgi:integrase
VDGSDPVLALADGASIGRTLAAQMLEEAVARCDAIPVDRKRLITFHVFRHTAASLMVANGVPLFDVAKILGHSTLAVTMRYAHFAPESGRTAIEILATALVGERDVRSGTASTRRG